METDTAEFTVHQYIYLYFISHYREQLELQRTASLTRATKLWWWKKVLLWRTWTIRLKLIKWNF